MTTKMVTVSLNLEDGKDIEVSEEQSVMALIDRTNANIWNEDIE